MAAFALYFDVLWLELFKKSLLLCKYQSPNLKVKLILECLSTWFVAKSNIGNQQI
ncbi:hypothetical protein Bca4012_001898 [Brassica carinata]